MYYYNRHTGESRWDNPTTWHASEACFSEAGPLGFLVQEMARPAIQKGTRVLVLLWDSLMFGRVLKSITIF